MDVWIWRLARIFFATAAGVFLILRGPWDYFACYGSVDLYCLGPLLGLTLVVGALVGLAVVWILAFITGHHRLKISLLALACVLLVLLNPYLPASPTVALGFHDRFGKRSPDELRVLAFAIDRAMRNDESTQAVVQASGLGHFHAVMEGKSKRELQQRFPFLLWMGGAEYITEKDHVVEIWWGGAPEGHWGAMVDLRGQAVQNPLPSSCHLYPVAPDVVFIQDNS